MTKTDPWTRLAHLWPLLALTRIPGTRRPWRPAELTGQQREDRDAKLRAERRMAEVFLEAQPAPLHLDVLDTLTQLHAQLLAAAAEFAMPQTAAAAMPTSTDDPGPLLDLCRVVARSAPDGAPVDHAAWDMLHVIERALGEIWDGQRLNAECPWCHGGVTGKPTWIVRMLPGDMPAIVCDSGACEPGRDAGTEWRGMPAWPLWEWDWLAQMLASEDERQAARRDDLARELAGRKAAQ